MTKRSKIELGTIVVVAILLLVGLLPALLFARQEYRDGIRRDEVAARKIQLERYFNAHEVYPLEFDASPHQYIVVQPEAGSAAGWFVRAKLENPHDPEVGFDEEAGRNYWYRYVTEQGATYYDVCGGTYECSDTAAGQ